jgi:hypothetical protein
MRPISRRALIANVGRGMIVAGVGSAVASDLGLAPAFADEEEPALRFGGLEPLVCAMQETPIGKLLPALVERAKAGVRIEDLVKAAALANARTFGGEDYVGFHTMMALAPAYHMARESAEERRLLPVLKVLYRNTNRIQEFGGRKAEVLCGFTSALPEGKCGSEALRAAVRTKDARVAELTFAALAQGSPWDAFNHLLPTVQDYPEVHRVVLPYRAYMLADLLGREHAHTLLRQSLRYCVRAERWRSAAWDAPANALTRALERHKLLDRAPGDRAADDAWVERLSRAIFEAAPEGAADAAAAALAEGFVPDAVGEAITLAANQLVLRDFGRTARDESHGKPMGSVHGDSIGVHACDSANAWRGMARASNTRNTYACLILGAYQAAFDRVNRGGDFLSWQPLPLAQHVEQVKATDADRLLGAEEEAIRANLQARAAAVAHRYGELGHSERPMFDLLRRYAVSEDGALHAEKFYRTVSEEFAATRAAFRWRHVVALARVTASQFGRPAAGYAEACELLKLT